MSASHFVGCRRTSDIVKSQRRSSLHQTHCISDHCISDHCISDHCISDHCISDHCISDHCISDHCIKLIASQIIASQSVLRRLGFHVSVVRVPRSILKSDSQLTQVIPPVNWSHPVNRVSKSSLKHQERNPSRNSEENW